MSTFLPKADEITRNWYVIDAAGKPLGRVASEAAALLRGKHKPIFTPNVDCGDFVIIINTDKAVLTGDKLNKKLYQHRHLGQNQLIIYFSQGQGLSLLNKFPKDPLILYYLH